MLVVLVAAVSCRLARLEAVHTPSKDPIHPRMQTVASVFENIDLVFGRRKDTGWLWTLHSIHKIEVPHRLQPVPRRHFRTCFLAVERMVARSSVVAGNATQ